MRKHTRALVTALAAALLQASGTAVAAAQSAAATPLAGIGPRTEAVAVEGYAERTEPHHRRYVSGRTGSDAGDGSRERPWASIPHALSSIRDARLGNRYAVLVAEGTYAGPTIQGAPYVDLWGGFEPGGWTRDVERHRTLLDGEGERRILVCADHSRIDGFVFTRGRVRGPGGAILCTGTSPVISNNWFLENRTLRPEGWNPEFLHEVAHDGGAIAALHGAAPVIRGNVFAFNSTETGRGAAIAAHNRAAPIIERNVIVQNTAGTDDPMRSSDGGGISAVQWSRPQIRWNVISGNRAISTNDGGGVFAELWSSLVLEGNAIVGNHGDDDGGGLFLAGQQHHYITVLDPVPPAESFLSIIRGNTFMGNRTRIGETANNGIARITNDARLIFEGNLLAHNRGGIDFRRTELRAAGNTILADVLVRESDQPALFTSDVIFGEVTQESEARLEGSLHLPATARARLGEHFREDGARLTVASARYDERRVTTTLRLARAPREAVQPGRVIRSGDEWAVVRAAAGSEIEVWGRLGGWSDVELMPTLTPTVGSPIHARQLGHAARPRG